MELYKLVAKRPYDNEPVFLKPSEGECQKNLNALIDKNGKIYPAQNKSDGVIAIITANKGDELTLTPVAAEICGALELEPNDDEYKKLIVTRGGEQFTAYAFDEKFAKPFLGPILNSNGRSFTRLDFNTKEHVHHRSVFEGIGDVSLDGCSDAVSIDFWNEPENRGSQHHLAFTELVSGSAYAEIGAELCWKSVNGTPVMDEKRTYTFYNQTSKCRYIDISIVFIAAYGGITFGKTKEAGPLGVRVAESMRVDKGNGVMRNSYGAVGESECWSKCAHWCDYSGNIGDGLQCGIAVFDNENNERYPTAWHIRDYGLFAPNNLYFKGNVRIEAGESLTYKYRLVFHEGAMTSDELNNRFIHYQNG